MSAIALVKDKVGVHTPDGIDFPTYTNGYPLAANTAQSVTVPTGATHALFAGASTFYVRYDGSAAAIPTEAVTNGTNAELNPKVRRIKGLSTLSLISPATNFVTVSFFKND